MHQLVLENKIALLPGKYVVTIKHKGYKSYSTAPGFSIVTDKFETFNIPLKGLLKYPIKTKRITIIAVFDTKTKRLIDMVLDTKKNKKVLEKRKNVLLFYGKRDHEKLAKGSLVQVFLEKQFVPGDQFISGDQFNLKGSKYKVVSSTKKELQLVKL